MSVCPNITSPEWLALEAAVGRHEAMRDWMENDQEIRTPQEVERKLVFTNMQTRVNALRGRYRAYEGELLDQTTAYQFGSFLTDKMGIPSEIIDDRSQEFKAKFTEDGTVVINSAYATSADPFHEYSHPLLIALRNHNADKFNKLYEELKTTKEYKDVLALTQVTVSRKYPELFAKDSKIENYKEEVLATAIGYLSAKKVSSKFRDVINKVLNWLSEFFSLDFNQPTVIDGIKDDYTLEQLVTYLTSPEYKITLPQSAYLDSVFNESPLLEETAQEVNVQMPEPRRLFPWEVPDDEINETDEEARLRIGTDEDIQRAIDKEEASQNNLDALRINKVAVGTPNDEEIQKMIRDLENVIKHFKSETFKMEVPFGLKEKLAIPQRDYTPRKEKEGKVTVKGRTRIPVDTYEDPNLGEPLQITTKFLNKLRKDLKGKTPLDKPFSMDGLTEYERNVLAEFKILIQRELAEWAVENNKAVPKVYPNDRLAERLERYLNDNYPLQLYDIENQKETYGILNALTDRRANANGHEVMISNGFFSKEGHRYDFKNPRISTRKYDPAELDFGGGFNTLGWFIYYKIGDKILLYEMQSDFVDGDKLVSSDELTNKVNQLKNVLLYKLRINMTKKQREMLEEKIRDAKRELNEIPLKEKKFYEILLNTHNGYYAQKHLPSFFPMTVSQLNIVSRMLSGSTEWGSQPLKDLNRTVKNLNKFLPSDQPEFPAVTEENQLQMEGLLYSLQKAIKGIREFKSNQETVLSPFKYIGGRTPWYRTKKEAQKALYVSPRQLDQDIVKAQYQLDRDELIKKSPIAQKYINNWLEAMEARFKIYFLKQGKDYNKIARLAKDTAMLKATWFHKSLLTSLIYAKKRGDNIVYLPTAEFMAGIGDAAAPYASTYDLAGSPDAVTVNDLPSMFSRGYVTVYKHAREHVLRELDTAIIIKSDDTDKKHYSDFRHHFEVTWSIPNKFGISAGDEGVVKSDSFSLKGTNAEIAEARRIHYEQIRNRLKEKFNELYPKDEYPLMLVHGMGGRFTIPTTESYPSYIDDFNFRRKQYESQYESLGGVFQALRKVKNIEYEYATIPEFKYKVIKVDLTNFNTESIERFSRTEPGISSSMDNYKKQLLDFLQDNYDANQFGVIKGQLSQHDIGMINKKISSMAVPDNWYVRQSKNGNHYIAGHRNISVYSNDYSTPQGRMYRGSLDPNSVRGFGIMHEDYTELEVADNSNVISNEAVRKIADKVSAQTGFLYEFISPQDAEAMLSKTKIRYNGEPAFFFQNKIYFVGENLTSNMVFHEFAHPIIRAILKENPELFAKLYNQLINTEEGRRIIAFVEEHYSDMDEGVRQEEAIVKALELDASDINRSTGFMAILKEILYHIKRILRRNFGKVDVAKLKSSTTLQDLSQMLAYGKKFTLESEPITEADIASYARTMKRAVIDNSQEIEEVGKISKQDLLRLTNKFYQFTVKQIDMVLKNKDYKAMLDILADEYDRGDLQEMRANLGNYTYRLEKRMAELRDEVQYTQNHVEALVNSYFRLSKMMNNIKSHMEDLVKDKDNPENIRQAYAYQKMVTYWKSFVKESVQSFSENKVPANSAIISLVNSIATNIDDIQRDIDKVFSGGIKTVINTVLEPVGQAITDRFESTVKTLKHHKASQHSIDRQYIEYYGMTEKEYDKFQELENQKKNGTLEGKDQREYDTLKRKSLEGLRITPEKLELLLKGQYGDANAISSFLEGYLYNSDPIVGGFALYVKRHLDEVIIRSQKQYNDFSKVMVPLLEDAGYNPMNIGKLGKDIGFVDELGYTDRNGEFKGKKVWSLLNPWKNYRKDLDELEHNVKQAERAYVNNNTDATKETLKAAMKARDDWEEKYMYQKYVKSYYQLKKIFERDELGREANFQRQRILDKIQAFNLATGNNEQDIFKTAQQIENAWQEYRELGSLYDKDGKVKVDVNKDGSLKPIADRGYSIALRIKEYQDASRDYNDYKLKTGAFENALQKYEESLLVKYGSVDDEQYIVERELWIEKNTRYVIKQEFYQRREEILNRIQEILAKIPTGEASNKKMLGAMNVMQGLLKGSRDQDGQPDGTRLNEDKTKMVKEVQEIISELRDSAETQTGLTRVENRRLSSLWFMLKSKDITQTEYDELQDLESRKKTYLTKNEQAELKGLWKSLREMQRKEATPYYIDTLNHLIRVVDSAEVHKLIGGEYLHTANADEIFQPKVLHIMMKNPDFKDWFNKNHIKKKEFDNQIGDEVTTYERLQIWDTIKPVDPAYVEKHIVTNADGSKEEFLLPSMRFYYRVVKDEFKTGYNPKTGKVELKVGVHVDNQGNFLPMPTADNKYSNEKYYELQQKNPKLFKVLTNITEQYLKMQEGSPRSSRLYMDFPRYMKSNLEVLQSRNEDGDLVVRSFLSDFIKRIKQWFTIEKNPDLPEEGYKWDDTFVLVRTDLLDEKISTIPVHGLYNIDHTEVSTDITNSMLRYMFSLERQKKLIEINPTAQALKSVLENNSLKDMKRVNKDKYLDSGELAYENKKGRYVRKAAVNALIEREFEGKTTTGIGSDSEFFHNISTSIFKGASFGFFALNIPSALKNSLSQKYQGLIEAAAGRYYNVKDFAKGEAWAFKAMGDLSFNLYSKEPKSLEVQMMEVWDPSEGRQQQKAEKEGLSRTVAKDVASFSWMYNFRKWVELQSSMQVFAAMLHHELIPTKDGGKVEWIKAWEVKDGNIQLKDNIPAEYGITYDQDGNQLIGEKFKTKRLQIQAVMRSLNGAYDSFNQPEAQRLMLFRFFSYLRKYFTTMFIDRFGFGGTPWAPKARLNVGLGTAAEGWYITLMKSMRDFFTDGPRKINYMTPDEKRAWMKALTDGAGLLLLLMLQSWLFDWDDKDPDKYKKLRAKSGALPFMFGVHDDPDREFVLQGWLANHALNLLMQVKAENQQFIPLPGLGFSNYLQLMQGGSAAFGPTIQTYADLFKDAAYMLMGNDKAFYKKDSGPYEWQQQGGSKFLAHLAKALGYTGSTTDPSWYIKSFQSIQARQ